VMMSSKLDEIRRRLALSATGFGNRIVLIVSSRKYAQLVINTSDSATMLTTVAEAKREVKHTARKETAWMNIICSASGAFVGSGVAGNITKKIISKRDILMTFMFLYVGSQRLRVRKSAGVPFPSFAPNTYLFNAGIKNAATTNSARPTQWLPFAMRLRRKP